ncbi:MAG: hypothetical protein OXN89_04585, partial [Bryobacterales bacterium]|nr:hypothetical protein [Bryobacterales bacterium]
LPPNRVPKGDATKDRLRQASQTSTKECAWPPGHPVEALSLQAPGCGEAARGLEHFRQHRQRMRYPEFRAQGLCVGSGAVEAGCKSAIGARMKGAGMHWTVGGANAILALRCSTLSNRLDDLWAERATTAPDTAV